MSGCQFCSFLSDPSTGNIFDPAFPCPKCGKRNTLRQARPAPLGGVNPMGGFAAPMTVGSNVVAAAKIAGLVACFFYLHNQLGHITDNDDRLGPIKRASYFIPAMSIPYVAELVTKEEWPILGTLFQVGVGGMAIKTALKIDTTEFTKTARASLGLKRKH
jgi:predicted RNA-binding Zn-ribbon protein involved in translation (DUF1610 family)